MLKAFRKITEHVSSGTSEDSEDRKHVQEIAAAAQGVKAAVAAYSKGLVEHTSRAAQLHQNLANLYPAGQSLSAAVGCLAVPGTVFEDAKASASSVAASLDAACTSIASRCRELLALADTRQVARLEMQHYREKVVKLANDGLADPKKQAKAETNQEKLAENQRQFRELDASVRAALGALDGEVAAVLHASLSLYMQEGARVGTGLVHCYGAALAAAASDAPPAGSGGAGAAAAASAEAQAFALHVAPPAAEREGLVAAPAPAAPEPDAPTPEPPLASPFAVSYTDGSEATALPAASGEASPAAPPDDFAAPLTVDAPGPSQLPASAGVVREAAEDEDDKPPPAPTEV